MTIVVSKSLEKDEFSLLVREEAKRKPCRAAIIIIGIWLIKSLVVSPCNHLPINSSLKTKEFSHRIAGP